MSDIQHEALPEGTIISTGEAPNVLEAERTATGWTEMNAHCVDCVSEWHPDGAPANWDAGDTVLDLGSATVTHVPAEWLRHELTGLLDSLDEHVTPEDVATAIRGLGIDAGLS